MTLDPRPHIRREPIGMVVLPIISVLVSGGPLGFASAPYDPRWAMRYPRRAGCMALAGPGANLVLVLAWQLFDRIFDPIFTFAISLLHPGVSYS